MLEALSSLVLGLVLGVSTLLVAWLTLLVCWTGLVVACAT